MIDMTYWCESCARKNNCYTIRSRPKCFTPITSNDRTADRKTEPETEEWHDDCNTCRWHEGACTIPCCDYEPQTEPQTDKEIILDPSFAELSDEQFVEAMKLIEPQTDCSWK